MLTRFVFDYVSYVLKGGTKFYAWMGTLALLILGMLYVFYLQNTEGLIVTGTRQIRTVRSVRLYSTTGGSSYTSMTSTQLAGLVRTPDGQLRRTDNDVWPAGFGNVVIEVEHGYDRPPNDLRIAASIRCIDALFRPDGGLPLRAKSWTDGAGVSYDLEIPDEFSTGIPRVDSVYHRHSKRVSKAGAAGGGRQGPASRTLSYDPQYYGLFRGGRT